MRTLQAIGLAVLLALTARGEVINLNLWSDFPIDQGINNFRAYGYNPGTLVYREITKTGDYSYFTDSQGGYPFVYKSGDGWVYMHPTSEGGAVYGTENAILSWTASADAVISISGAFAGAGTGDKYVYIRKDSGGGNLWGAQADKYNNGVSLPFSLTDVAVNAGERLLMGVQSLGSQSGDQVKMQGSIVGTMVPEPSVSAILALAMGAWAWAIRIRRRGA